jgi:SAM-dependent methyltransferase
MVIEQAERHYRGEAGAGYHQGKRAVPDLAIPWVARVRAEKLARFVKPTDVVFEFGAGFGWNLARLNCRRKLAFDLEDLLSPAFRAAGVEFVADIRTITDGSVNVAICHHALEHVMQPVAVLGELHRMLAADGKLLLFVPLEQRRKYGRFEANEPNHHLYSWNVQSLGNLVEETGFRVVEAVTGVYGYDRFAATWAVRRRLGEGGFRVLRRLLNLVRPEREVRIVAARK